MKTNRTLVSALIAASALWPSLFAQTTAPAPAQPAAAPSKLDDEVLQLSPFEVTAEEDTGYVATETLAGTRIRTDLKDVGSAISVITKEFMKDVGATDNSTLLQYTTNAEVAGTKGTYAGLGNSTEVSETGALRSPGGAQRMRGLAAADNARDFFVSDIPWDSYNVDRIDIQRGPNSILFGLGSPAGIVNASMRNAEFRNKGSIDFRVGSYNSARNSIDVNHVLVKDVLAIRIDYLWNKEKYQQKPAFQDDKRFYGAIRFEPQIFKDPGFRTTIKAKYEHGEIDANRPRLVPPNDSITPWFRPVNLDPNNLLGGAGKLTVNNGYEVGAAISTYSPWFISDSIANQQQPIWFMDGNKDQLYRIYGGYVGTGSRTSTGAIQSATTNLIGQRYSSMFYGLNNFANYAANARLTGSAYGQYRVQSLQDPSVYDFYHNLLDGPTKSEFEDWNAYNVSFAQTGWGDRVGLELNYDHQKYKRGGQSLVTNPTINIDVLRNFQDFSANPNFGRPYVVGGPGGGDTYESQRKYYRASVFGEVRARDFFRSDFMVKLLGKHRFNGVYSDEEYFTENRGWRQYIFDAAWDNYWTQNRPIEQRPPVGVIYLGSSLSAASTAAGANIPNITQDIQLKDGNVYHFSETWQNFGVPFGDPWTVPTNLEPIFGVGTTGLTQASNPANYIGWSNLGVNLIRSNYGTDQRTLTSARMARRNTKSLAGSWQGYWWNDALVTTLGWRYDEVQTRRVTALLPSGSFVLNMSPGTYRLPDQPLATDVLKDHSTSGGAVLHLNRLFARDPLPINVSLSYSKSSNFQVVNVRKNIFGSVIANPTGSTKDYGILLSTKDGKYSFRALRYETTVLNSDTTINARGLTDTIVNGLNWRNILLYRMEGYALGQGYNRNLTATTVNVRHDWLPVYVNSAGRAVAPGNSANPPAGSTLQTAAQANAMRDASIRAWNDVQKWLTDKGYFSAWGFGAGPTTAAALTDRSTLEGALPKDGSGNIIADSLPTGVFAPDPTSIFDYRTAPKPDQNGFAVTADTMSKGYEFELTANPTKNWRISFNAAQTTASRSNVGGAAFDEIVTYLKGKIAGAAGDVRMFNARFDDPTNVIWNNGTWTSFVGQYNLLKLQEGASVPENRKWRYNIVTNYNFPEGRLKGFNVGSSYRWQDKVIIGYPVVAVDANNFSFDLSKPYHGPSESGLDLWVGYERKVSEKVKWRIQANVRNVGKDNDLIPISVQPDGHTWASVRVSPVQEWFVTNTFSF